MSDSDDDLLALADVGSDSEVEQETSTPTFSLEGKYIDEADRAKLLALPEIEREAILYERAQETQRASERQYLLNRQKSLKRPEVDSETPAAKRQRGTTGVNDGTKTSLAALKKKRSEQQRRLNRGVSDGESSSEFSDEESASEQASDDASDSESMMDVDDSSNVECSLSDVNKVRWGKTLFHKYAMYPHFETAVPHCFVRVNIGQNSSNQTVYRLCLVKKVEQCKPYTFMNRTVDQQLLVAFGNSERHIQFSICSDSPVRIQEFEKWQNAMHNDKLQIPSRRKLESKFKEIRALSKHVLTTDEVDELVQRRAKLSNQRGASAVLQRAELTALREEAQDANNDELVKEIDSQLNRGTSAQQKSHRDHLQALNERNKRMNVEAVRRAEIQANAERRKGGAQASNPFSRLKPNAPKGNFKAEVEPKVALAVVDDLIAQVDVQIDLEMLV